MRASAVARRLFQAVHMVGGQGLVLCVGADQEQLHQRGRAFAGPSARPRPWPPRPAADGRAFIQRGPQQRLPVLASRSASAPRRQLLLFGGSHLGPVQRIGDGEQLHAPCCCSLSPDRPAKHFSGHASALVGLDGSAAPVILQQGGGRARRSGYSRSASVSLASDRLDGLGHTGCPPSPDSFWIYR